MKVLILSIKAGYGHHSTGKAIEECFTEHGCECLMLDTFEYINRFLCDGIQDGYLLSTKYLKEAYGKVYSTLDKRDEPFKKFSPTEMISKLISKKLVKFVEDYSPDIVIGTHSYAAVLMTILAKRGNITCPTIGIITDFTVHPFWESTELDAYVVPDSLLTLAAQRKGIPAEKVIPTGIPLKKSFTYKHNKEEMRSKLGLKNLPSVLIMMGSMGFGNILNIIKTLDDFEENFQIICICGNNEKSRKSIEEECWCKNVVNLGFTNNVDEYMDASDVIITKPGGLTTSEAMAKGLPMILMNPIPGQEERNMNFLVNAGVGIGISEVYPLEFALYAYFMHPWKQDVMHNAVEHMGKPNAADDLYKYSMELIESKNGMRK